MAPMHYLSGSFDPLLASIPPKICEIDFRNCSASTLEQLRRLTPHATQVPWGDLRYIFGDIMYGGHITDPYDRILCR